MGPLYHKFNILKLGDLYRLELGKFMHMFFSKLIPRYFNDYFIEFKNAINAILDHALLVI